LSNSPVLPPASYSWAVVVLAATFTSCRLWHVPTLALFGWANVMQHRCYIKLAKLRRNRMGEC